jgi:hypothetical protein
MADNSQEAVLRFTSPVSYNRRELGLGPVSRDSLQAAGEMLVAARVAAEAPCNGPSAAQVRLASLAYRLRLRPDDARSAIHALASVIGLSGLTDRRAMTVESGQTILETSTHPTTPNSRDVPMVSPNLRGKLMLVRTKNTSAPTAAHRKASIST